MVRSIYISHAAYIKCNFIIASISGRWVAPNVIGHHPYFCRSCIPLPNNRALVIGGLLMFTVYLAQCTETEVVGTVLNKIILLLHNIHI